MQGAKHHWLVVWRDLWNKGLDPHAQDPHRSVFKVQWTGVVEQVQATAPITALAVSCETDDKALGILVSSVRQATSSHHQESQGARPMQHKAMTGGIRQRGVGGVQR